MQYFSIPTQLSNYFKCRKWSLLEYQISFLEQFFNDKNKRFLLLSSTGTGKTITSFFPIIIKSLQDINCRVFYISPIRSLINDLEKNLKNILKELCLDLIVEKRTSDETYHKKIKQINNPPHITLTTPESLALLVANPKSSKLLDKVSYIIIDELNDLINSKRGDLLVLCLSFLQKINPNIKIIGCSAISQNLSYLKSWISCKEKVITIKNQDKKKINIEILPVKNLPTSGHYFSFDFNSIIKILKNKKSLIFVNTRAQSEILFNELQKSYPQLRLGIHHGSLSRSVRQLNERGFVLNKFDSLICTSSLELGIDWKNIDNVINIGTPKSVNRLIQRAGRSNHDIKGQSISYLVPTNKLEYLECLACKKLVEKGSFDELTEKKGSKDVLCQYLLIRACRDSFSPDIILNEIKSTYAYKDIELQEFNSILQFICNGGYILNRYDKWKKLVKNLNGTYTIKDNKVRRNILINVGTIVDSTDIKIIDKKGRLIGLVEDSFFNSIKIGESFIFSGDTFKCIKLNSDEIIVDSVKKKSKKVPVYWGGTMSITSNLSQEIIKIFNRKDLPPTICNFINSQKKKSILPSNNCIIIEKFSLTDGEYLCFHSFMGRETNQTISNLLINFLKNLNIDPINYYANEYSVCIFFMHKTEIKVSILDDFFAQEFKNIDFLNSLIAKKIFKEVAFISGLVNKNSIEKKFKKKFVNCDILFDTLMKYDPEHIILKITREEIQNHFLKKSQFYKLKEINYQFVELDQISEFSRIIINEKEKIKISELL